MTQWNEPYPGTKIAAEPLGETKSLAGCVIDCKGKWVLLTPVELNGGYETYLVDNTIPADAIWITGQTSAGIVTSPLLPGPSCTREQALAALSMLLQATPPECDDLDWGIHAESGEPILDSFELSIGNDNSAAVRRDLDKRDVLSAWWKQQFAGEAQR